MQMARFHDITVLTQSKNRPGIEKALQTMHGSQPEPQFVYFDLPKWLQQLRKAPIGLRLYYVFWQKWARAEVRRLHEQNHFDLLHHVTFAAFRYPTAIWGHGVPCIWGPIGGIESIPAPLLPWSHPFSLVHEVLRNISNLFQATPYRDLPKRAADSDKVLVSTREMQEALATLNIESHLMPTIGLKTHELPFQPHRPSEGPLKMLFVGKIITLKGIDLAMKALAESGTDATLTLVGTGVYLRSAQRLAERLGLGQRVTFRGQMTRQEVLSLYSQFDLMVFPSLHDTGGYAVIEAMYNELPVICLDCGGPAVAVQAGCGIKVPLGSRAEVISGLAAAIRHYDSDRQALLSDGKAAHQSILDHYDWDKKGAEMNQIYEECVTGKPGKSRNKTSSGRGGTTGSLYNLISMRGATVALIGMLLLGAWGFFSVHELRHEAQQIVEDTLPGLSFAGKANAYIAESSRTLFFITNDNPAERARLRDEINESSRRTTIYLDEYNTTAFSREDRDNVESLRKIRANYIHVRDQVLDLAVNRKKQEALAMYHDTLLPLHAQLKDAADKLFDYNMRQGQVRGRRIMLICSITQIALAVTSVAIFLLGFFFGLFK